MPAVVALLTRVFFLVVSLVLTSPLLESLLWLGSFDAARTMLDVPASALPLLLSEAVVLPRLLPMVALLSSLLAREEGGPLSPQSLYPPMLLPCCHGPTFVFVAIFVTPKLSNIAAT